MAALRSLKDERKREFGTAVKQVTNTMRDARGFVPSYSGGRVRRIPVE